MRNKFIYPLLGSVLFVSCHDMLEELYDTPTESIDIREGQLYVDASSWLHWYYLDFNTANRNFSEGKTSSAFVRYEIPTKELNHSANSTSTTNRAGIYTYWYDVFGTGLSNHEFRSFTPTAPQSAPASWHIAVHRNNVRTNGGAVYETTYTSMNELPESSEAFKDETFMPDAWNETDVWTVQGKMLNGLIGNQGIDVNPVLSKWLSVSIPPLPPAFTLNTHVFIVRFSDNTYAALQLEDYVSTIGTKCCLTINYKYPY